MEEQRSSSKRYEGLGYGGEEKQYELKAVWNFANEFIQVADVHIFYVV